MEGDKDFKNDSNVNDNNNKIPSSSELEENSKLVESFINDQIGSIDSAKLNDMFTTSKSIDKVKIRIIKNINDKNAIENYVNFCGNIVKFCNEVCNPFVSKNNEQCGLNCIDKYFDQLNTFNKNQEYYAKELSLSEVFFLHSENFKYSKMLSNKI